MAWDVFSITEIFNAIFVTRDVEVDPAFPSLSVGATELRTRVQITIQNLVRSAEKFMPIQGFRRSSGSLRTSRAAPLTELREQIGAGFRERDRLGPCEGGWLKVWGGSNILMEYTRVGLGVRGGGALQPW